MRIIRQRAYARAGLLGNPSDGYRGRTISFLFRNFHAEVVLYDWEMLEILPSQEDHGRFSSIHDLVHDVELHGYYGGVRLIKATIKRFAEYCAHNMPVVSPAIAWVKRPSLFAIPATSPARWGWPDRARSLSPRCGH